MPFPSLEEIADNTPMFTETPDGLMLIAQVVRANVIAIGEEPDAKAIYVLTLARIGRILSTLGAKLTEARLQIINLEMKSSSARLH